MDLCTGTLVLVTIFTSTFYYFTCDSFAPNVMLVRSMNNNYAAPRCSKHSLYPRFTAEVHAPGALRRRSEGYPPLITLSACGRARSGVVCAGVDVYLRPPCLEKIRHKNCLILPSVPVVEPIGFARRTRIAEECRVRVEWRIRQLPPHAHLTRVNAAAKGIVNFTTHGRGEEGGVPSFFFIFYFFLL